MIYYKLTIVLICAGLFSYGGFSWHNARRFLMPLILTITCSMAVHAFWGLTMLLSIVFLCIGYGDKSAFRHIFGNGWGRGVWGFLVALALSLGLFLTGHIAWYFFAGYLALNFTLENALKNINQVVGDLIIGAGFASIIFLIY